MCLLFSRLNTVTFKADSSHNELCNGRNKLVFFCIDFKDRAKYWIRSTKPPAHWKFLQTLKSVNGGVGVIFAWQKLAETPGPTFVPGANNSLKLLENTCLVKTLWQNKFPDILHSDSKTKIFHNRL